MKLTILSLLALATDAVFSWENNCSSSNHLTVKTSTGIYTGLIDPEFPNTRQFRNIPFAEPPVLSRRWAPPEKLPPSSKRHYATRYPPSCAQFVTAQPSIYALNLTHGNLIYNGNQNDSSGLVGEASSEDCLYMAIWTPKIVPKAGLPVLFFMTGGGFILGGVDIPWQYGTPWVERSQEHIIVSINYRLTIFGFPRARGLKNQQQNLGFLDQRLALEWVRDNIAAFGGDPNRIMLWGQSAGSIAVDYHAYAWYKDPIARSFWMQSGSAFSATPGQDPTHSNFSFVARQFGCENPCGIDDDGVAELECMRQVPFAQIMNFVGQYGDRGELPKLAFNLIRDDRIVFTNYTARSEEGKIARGPALISTTANEYSTLVPWPVNNLTEGPWQPLVTAADINGICAIFNNSVAYRNKADIPVFRLQYAGIFPNLNVYKWLGAYHASDLPLSFGTYHDLDIIANTTKFEVEVSHAFQDYVLAFAKDPYHGPQKMGWKPLVAGDLRGDVLRIGADGKAAQIVDDIEVDGMCLGAAEFDPFP